MDKKRAAKIYDLLDKAYPGATTALSYKKPHELLIATILSAQCTDKRVNIVTKELFRKYRSVSDFSKVSESALEKEIRSTGFFRSKAKHIIGSARKIEADFGGKVPRSMVELVSLPGVARKTANIVLFHAFGKIEGIAVDTHVKRISARLEFTGNTDPVKIERDLMGVFAKEKWGDLTNILISHGRKICRFGKPLCGECSVRVLCSYQAGKKMSKIDAKEKSFSSVPSKSKPAFLGRNITAAFIAALLFLSLPSCGNDFSSSVKGKLYSSRYVVDGDTIELSMGERVRYIGIDTPETRKKEGGKWVFKPEVYGMEAKNRNAELVEGKVLELEFDLEKKDKYGRCLAYVYADGVMVNLQLIKEGFATVYTFPPNVKYYSEMIRSQSEALEAERGFWGTLKKISASDAEQYCGMFCRVSGKVLGKEVLRGRVLLHLEAEGTGRLDLVIFLRNFPLFQNEGIDPLTCYDGKNIEVFGKVEGDGSYPGMIVDNPFQIKMLEK